MGLKCSHNIIARYYSLWNRRGTAANKLSVKILPEADLVDMILS